MDVYIKADENDRITACDGGYSTRTDFTGWILIDNGDGDKYSHCQNYYFDGGLLTSDGIPRYKLIDGAPQLRSDTEIQSDRDALPSPPPDRIAVLERQLADLQTLNDELTEALFELAEIIEGE